MIKRVIVRSHAKRDIREAKQWYRNISQELGADFLSAVDDAILLAQKYPLAFSLMHRTFRRVLLRRFPYALFYQSDSESIIIVGVLHQARDPELLEKL